MSNQISLRETERKVYQSAFQDGLVDISIGCFILMFAIGPFLTTYLGDFWGSVVFVPFWALCFLILWLIRRFMVQPRIGLVRFGPWRIARVKRFSAVMLFICTLAFILGILSVVRFDAVPGWMHTARFSLVFLLGFSVAGYLMEFTRLYLYGILIALSPLIGELLYEYLQVPHHGYPVTFGFTAVLMIATGLVLLIRLLRDHPLYNQVGPVESIE